MAANNSSGSKNDIAVRHMECLRNHGAKSMQTAILDGCGEFAPTGIEGTPKFSHCAACGCHRNFHKRIELELPESTLHLNIGNPIDAHVPTPELLTSSTTQLQQQAINQIQTSLQTTEEHIEDLSGGDVEVDRKAKRKMRTRFNSQQIEKMIAFAYEIGWTVKNCDEKEMMRICSELEISPPALRNWINNNRRKATVAQLSNGAETSNLANNRK